MSADLTKIARKLQRLAEEIHQPRHGEWGWNWAEWLRGTAQELMNKGRGKK